MRAGLIAPLLLLSCAETPAAPVDETRYWLEVCAAHNYSQAETAMAYPRLVGERIERTLFGLLRRLFTFRPLARVRLPKRPPRG